jgi:hypothetical protein
MLESEAFALIRWDVYEEGYEISGALEEWLGSEGCEDLTELEGQRYIAFQGDYVPARPGDEQWLVLCVKAGYSRLLVVLPEEPADVHELAGMAGTWDWILAAAPPQYFDYMTALRFGYKGLWHVPRPEHDIALAEFRASEADERFAIFWTEDGWEHVVVRCCHWPD